MEKKYEKTTWGNLKFAESECDHLENELAKITKDHQDISKRMKTTANHLGAIRCQLKQIPSGGGATLFPCPISRDVSSPSTTLCMINACLLCGFWFAYYNFIPAPCGHTYHLWCIAEYARVGSTCIVSSCKIPFFVE